MQAIGVLIIAIGAWIFYCSVYGIAPWQTAVAVIQDPNAVNTIVGNSVAASRLKYAALFTALGVGGASASASGTGGTVAFTGSNPFSKYSISDDAAAHVARGGSPAIDYVMPVGTPLPALFSGVVTFEQGSGSGGWITTITRSDGWKALYLHNSKQFTELSGKTVPIGTIVALSGGAAGAPGAGDSTGPHLHLYIQDPNGTYVDPAKFFLGTAK